MNIVSVEALIDKCGGTEQQAGLSWNNLRVHCLHLKEGMEYFLPVSNEEMYSRFPSTLLRK